MEAFPGLFPASPVPDLPEPRRALVSTADIDLLGPPQADDLFNPEFAVVLRGYDPEEVRSYVQNVATHVEAVQRQLSEARDQIEAGRRQYMAAKEAAYKQLATQLADLLHTADMEAERLKREGAEEALRTTSEAERIAAQTRRDAEEHAEDLRREGEELLWRSRAESDRILGGLSIKRDEILTELEASRGRLRGVMASLESTITATREEAKRGSEAAVDVAERAHEEAAALEAPRTIVLDDASPMPEDQLAMADETSETGSEVPQSATPNLAWEVPRADRRQRDAMLDSVEGFDLVLPDVRIDEEGELN
jgi:DivIVA domain-containing protein